MNNPLITVMALAFLSLGFLAAPSSASAQSSQFLALDSDEIIATSENMLLRHDLRSGHLAITFVNGKRLEFNLEPLTQPEWELPAPVLDFHAGGPYYGQGRDDRTQGSACDAEANTLQSAINGVQSACGNNNEGQACAAAVEFYQSASDAYTACVLRVFYDMK